jgi:hypothetical protein
MEGDKLKVLVRMDVDCNSARIEVKGNVDSLNIRALYAVARRAASLAPGLGTVLDLGKASATSHALDELLGCAELQALPANAGPDPVPCNLSVVVPKGAAAPGCEVALAA